MQMGKPMSFFIFSFIFEAVASVIYLAQDSSQSSQIGNVIYSYLIFSTTMSTTPKKKEKDKLFTGISTGYPDLFRISQYT